ncbi:MAG: hypothetical protein M3Q58_14380 [Bacteroidota bacterium]|nr:hypothetical protein [Bacteroidota bacterium]
MVRNIYPFGSPIPSRSFNSSSCRYGFQGQERDDEVKGSGNSLNYKYRMYDPRIGRFFAVDPLSPKYPFYSPYAFSGNRVIDARELEGLEPESVVTKTSDGKYHFTKPAIHLLSLVSGVPTDRITQVQVLPKSYGRIPYYSPNADGTGGGAVTVSDRIVYTPNFFEGKYSTSLGILPWLGLSSHEVGHLPQADEYGDNAAGKLAYMGSFLVDYAVGFLKTGSIKGAHDSVEREDEADKGRDNFYGFNNYVNDNYGKDQLWKLFKNKDLSDEDKIGKIDSWYQSYQESLPKTDAPVTE